MLRSRLSLFLLGAWLSTAASPAASAPAAADIQPPRAKQAPTTLEGPDATRSDPYYWLNQRDNPEVIAYLEAENAYTDAMMAHTEPFQEELFREITGRIKKNDASVPYRYRDYYYYTRYEDKNEYPLYCRQAGSLDAPEEIMLDANALAEGHEFFSVRGTSVSSDQDILAFSMDTVGRRIYTIRFKNLETGEFLPDEIPAVTGNLAWAEDNRTLFYTKQDPETLRWDTVYRHVLGTNPAGDPLVFEETDDTFEASVMKTKSRKYIVIESDQTLSTECRYLDAANPAGEFTVFLPRERDHEYSIDHFQDAFYIRTNDHARNFRLMKTPVTATSRENWIEIIPNRDDVLLEGFEIFRDQLVVEERKNGLIQIRIRPWSGEDEHYLDFGEPAYLAYLDDNREFDTGVLRFVYESMTTPSTVYDYDMVTREKTMRKQDEVLGGFDAGNYRTERRYAPARDGVTVPVSIVYRKETPLDGTSPLLLYGYGSYGYSMDAYFSYSRLSLLDRGFVYAIAHVRGGEEMGRQWYEDGKLLNKKNTFTDFIDCAEYLIREKIADPGRVFAEGGSAGGLLMGAVVNMRPDLWRGVVADVPFVDVMTTMLDPSIPLTTGEYDEWGNPNEKTYYDYMLSYSPYDNVEATDYPNLLVTTSLHDSQVQYFEPAKWVAKLRAWKTDHNLLILKTNMEAGHGGASGRLKQYRETALAYAFMIDLAGLLPKGD
jgi:oligopeptidase B